MKLFQSIGQHKRLVINLTRVLVTAGGIALVVRLVDVQGLWHAVSLANWRLIGWTLLLFQVGMGIRALRWRALLGALQSPPRFLRLVGLYYASAFFNTFLPTGFGGDVGRILETSQESAPDIAIAAVGLDRLSGLYILFIIALLVLPIEASILPVQLVLVSGTVCVLGIAGWFLLLYTNILPTALSWVASRLTVPGLAYLIRIVALVREIDRRALRQAVGASVAFDLLLIITSYMIAQAFGLDVSILTLAVFTPLSSLLLLLPSIQGLGVREPVYVLLLGSVGVSTEQAVAFSVGVYMLNLSTGLVGAIYYTVYSLVTVLRRQTPPAP